MNILQKATPKHQRLSDSTTAKHQRLSDYVTPRLISLVVCMSVLLLGSCRKSPKAINPVATEGNLTIQLNCLGADLRADENDPMSAVEKLDLYFFSSESEPAERTMVAHRTFSKAKVRLVRGYRGVNSLNQHTNSSIYTQSQETKLLLSCGVMIKALYRLKSVPLTKEPLRYK